MYDKHGFQKDENIALSWYKKAHEGGNTLGTAFLGQSILQGLGGATKCPIRALVYITHAASQGSSFAAYQLGMVFANGWYPSPVRIIYNIINYLDLYLEILVVSQFARSRVVDQGM